MDVGGVKVIRTSRIRMVVLILIAAVFVAGGVLMVAHPSKPDDAMWGWAVVGFFGLGGLVFAYHLIWPARLTLDQTGFTHGGLLRTTVVAWRDVEELFLYKLPRGGKMVAWRLRPDRRPKKLTAALNRMMGVDGGVPSTWTVPPKELLELMEQWRQRYGRA